jgi:hypothetical protein
VRQRSRNDVCAHEHGPINGTWTRARRWKSNTQILLHSIHTSMRDVTAGAPPAAQTPVSNETRQQCAPCMLTARQGSSGQACRACRTQFTEGFQSRQTARGLQRRCTHGAARARRKPQASRTAEYSTALQRGCIDTVRGCMQHTTTWLTRSYSSRGTRPSATCAHSHACGHMHPHATHNSGGREPCSRRAACMAPHKCQWHACRRREPYSRRRSELLACMAPHEHQCHACRRQSAQAGKAHSV